MRTDTAKKKSFRHVKMENMFSMQAVINKKSFNLSVRTYGVKWCYCVKYYTIAADEAQDWPLSIYMIIPHSLELVFLT